MNMKKNILYQCAILTAVIGLIIIFTVMLSGVAYPHMLFRIGTPLGLVFIFASVLLLFLSWLWDIHHAIKGKQYLLAIGIAVLGLIVIVRILIRLR